MDANLAKKLLYKEADAPYCIINLPASLQAAFKGKGLHTELPAKENVPFLILFVQDVAGLEAITSKAIKAMAPDGKLWVAYPKISSGIKTDITRDKGWEAMTSKGWQHVSLISLDDTWSAFRMKPTAEEVEVRHKGTPGVPGVDMVNRIVTPPADLVALFKKSPEAKKKFETLSFSHRREFVIWIESAKQAATRERRLQGTVEKLLQGKTA